jgi:hypothetical protein
MGPIAQVIEEQVALDVLEEAYNEVRGRSAKKWGIIVVALAVGAIVAYFVMRRNADDGSELDSAS